MSVANIESVKRVNAGDFGRPESDTARLKRIRGLVDTDVASAKRQAWEWLKELQAPGQHHRLPWLFSQGTAPESPDGDCEGIVMNLYGSPWLVGLDRLVRLGQLLGGIGWAGKTFNRAKGTGYNRLTGSSRIPSLIATPHYKYEKINGELCGFHFFHDIEPSPLPPHALVRAIKYDAPIHNNPLVLPRTRDELVEIVPDVYLGRALLRNAHDWEVVGYFGSRFPVGG